MDVILILVGYTVGTIPFALLLARRMGGTDVRYVGSGNVGAANVLRTTGTSVALIVMTLDVSKGCAAVLLAEGTGADDAVRAAVGAAAVVDHVFPVLVEVSRWERRGDRLWCVRGVGTASDGGGGCGVRAHSLDHTLRVGGINRGVAPAAAAGVSGERVDTGGCVVDRGWRCSCCTGIVPTSHACSRETSGTWVTACSRSDGSRVDGQDSGARQRRMGNRTSRAPGAFG